MIPICFWKSFWLQFTVISRLLVQNSQSHDFIHFCNLTGLKWWYLFADFARFLGFSGSLRQILNIQCIIYIALNDTEIKSYWWIGNFLKIQITLIRQLFPENTQTEKILGYSAVGKKPHWRQWQLVHETLCTRMFICYLIGQ